MRVKVGFLVLGMHRSGTSALTGLLHALGVHVGGELIPPGKDNPRGFFEDRRVVAINEELFRRRGWWHEEVAVHEHTNWPAVPMVQQRMSDLLLSEFAPHDWCCLKDPRLCRTLPAWRSTLQASGIDWHVLHVVRDPFEVAASLMRRNRMPADKALCLWLLHTLEAVVNTVEFPSHTLSHRRLMEDWRSELTTLEGLLPQRDPGRDRRASAFLEADLWHERNGLIPAGDPELLTAVKDAERLMLQQDAASREAGARAILGEMCQGRLRPSMERAATDDARDKTRTIDALSTRISRLENQAQRFASHVERLAELTQATTDLRRMNSELHSRLHVEEDRMQALRNQLERDRNATHLTRERLAQIEVTLIAVREALSIEKRRNEELQAAIAHASTKAQEYRAHVDRLRTNNQDLREAIEHRSVIITALRRNAARR